MMNFATRCNQRCITSSTFKRALHGRCRIENEVRKLRRLYLVIPMRLSRVVSPHASIGEQSSTASKRCWLAFRNSNALDTQSAKRDFIQNVTSPKQNNLLNRLDSPRYLFVTQFRELRNFLIKPTLFARFFFFNIITHAGIAHPIISQLYLNFHSL